MYKITMSVENDSTGTVHDSVRKVEDFDLDNKVSGVAVLKWEMKKMVDDLYRVVEAE